MRRKLLLGVEIQRCKDLQMAQTQKGFGGYLVPRMVGGGLEASRGIPIG